MLNVSAALPPLLLLLWWRPQITKPPEFADPAATFQTGPAAGSAGVEGTSHIAGQQEVAARRLVEQLARYRPEGGAAFGEALGLLEKKMLGAGAERFRVESARAPHSTALAAGHAVCLYQLGQFDESARLLLELGAGAAAKGDERLVELIGETAGASTMHRQATIRWLQTNPGGAAKLHLARLIAAESPAEAVALWKQAARLRASDPRPCLELARVAAADRDALHWLKAALAREEKLPDAHYRLSRLYQKSGQTDLAARHLQRFGELKGKR